MSNLKKKIPLTVLELLEPFLLKGNNRVKLINPNGFLMKFIDTDDTSDFYYNIEQYKIERGSIHLLIDRKPRSMDTVESYKTWIESKTFEQNFKAWAMYIDRYEQIKTIYDDPIETKYQEEFYSEFEIIDEDADKYSFNLEQQLWIDSYLDKVLLAIEIHVEFKEDKGIQEIKKNTQDLKNNLTILSKKEIVQKLSKIWAKTRKHGLIFLKEIYIEVRSELIKQIIQAQLPK